MNDMDPASHPSPVSMTSNDGEKIISRSPRSVASPKPSDTSPRRVEASDEMEKVETNSRKRSSAEQSEEEEASSEPSAKRRKTDEGLSIEHKVPTPSPTPEPVILAAPITTPFFDDAPKQLLQRSCALILDHVGFDSASKEALEALCGEVDIYMTKVLSYVTESMLAARRSQPTPPDFEFAMRHMGLTSRLLTPHLKPPVPPSTTELVFRLAEAEAELPHTPAELLGQELNGESDKRTKKYIPAKFPAFPSKHTYKATSVIPDRENDPRKIREKATQAARNAEEALRRLVKVGKTGTHAAKRGLENDKNKKARNELWEQSMAAFSKDRSDVEEKTISVDAEKRYWRRPVLRTGKSSASGT